MNPAGRQKPSMKAKNSTETAAAKTYGGDGSWDEMKRKLESLSKSGLVTSDRLRTSDRV